jgi:hypothetical protein
VSAGGMAPVLFDRGLLVRLARLSAGDRLAVLRALPEPGGMRRRCVRRIWGMRWRSGR